MHQAIAWANCGRQVTRVLARQCVVFDRNPESEPAYRRPGGVEVIGDATNPDDFRTAGIDRAEAFIAACDADSENLVVALTDCSIDRSLAHSIHEKGCHRLGGRNRWSDSAGMGHPLDSQLNLR